GDGTNAFIRPTNSGGGLYIGANGVNTWIFHQSGALLPFVDDGYNLGAAANRVKTIYATSGSINTSDENSKDSIEGIPEEWLDAWADVRWARYKFKDAAEQKGDDAARWHVGLIAQKVRDAFQARGLDATQIGLLCFDKWE